MQAPPILVLRPPPTSEPPRSPKTPGWGPLVDDPHCTPHPHPKHACPPQGEPRSLCPKQFGNARPRLGLRTGGVGGPMGVRCPGEGGTQRGRKSSEAGKGGHSRRSWLGPVGKRCDLSLLPRQSGSSSGETLGTRGGRVYPSHLRTSLWTRRQVSGSPGQGVLLLRCSQEILFRRDIFSRKRAGSKCHVSRLLLHGNFGLFKEM